MNNRYICRGKRKDNDEWIEGYLIQGNKTYIATTEAINYMVVSTSCMASIELVEVIPETVGQCTGLKDKNGKLIFENDIIVTDKFNTPEIKYTITYDKELAAFIGEYRKGCIKHFTTFDDDSNCFEVIGNIHDNPELLEKLICIN